MLNLVEKLLIVSSRERGFGAQQGIGQDTDGPDIDGMRVGMVQNLWCHVKLGPHERCQLLERSEPMVGVVPTRETKVDDANIRQAFLVLGVGFRFEEEVFELFCGTKVRTKCGTNVGKPTIITPAS